MVEWLIKISIAAAISGIASIFIGDWLDNWEERRFWC